MPVKPGGSCAGLYVARERSGVSAQVSAGILAFRRRDGLEVLLAHPGGPYWTRRDEGAWSIPKGAVESGDLLKCAVREFNEETGLKASGPFLALTPLRQKGGKLVHAFALEADYDLVDFSSNLFEMNGRRAAPNVRNFRRSTVSPTSTWTRHGEKFCPDSGCSSRSWWRG